MCSGCGGCKAKPLPEVYVNRANDTAYFEQLLKMHDQQKEMALVQVAISQQMTQHVEQVRATFPQDVDEGTLNAALAADSKWQELEAQAKAQADIAQQFWVECRDAIRDRMLEQNQAEQDVRRGKARAADKPLERVVDGRKKE